jgi:hypothetical protein
MIRPQFSVTCVCLFALMASTPCFTQPTGAINNERWHIGTFSGQLTNGNERTAITVTCDSQSVCEYAFATLPQAPGPVNRSRANNVQVIDVTIPNNNLLFTRNAVRADPEAYSHKSDGFILRELRTLLESQATFDACVGVPESAGAWGRLCKLDTEDATLPTAVLLVTTMNPTCNGKRFCAYYIFPLRRSSLQSGG